VPNVGRFRKATQWRITDVKHQGPLWHEDRPLSLGMQAVEDDLSGPMGVTKGPT
jgi:hypothetical protein